MIPVARFRNGIEQLGSTLAPFVLTFIGIAKRDARFHGEFFNRSDKVEVLDLAHKRNDIALGATPEAVIELLLGIDRERTRLLLVEWAEALPAPTDSFQLNMLGDDRDNVSGIPYRCDVIVLNAHVCLRAGR